VSLFEFVNPELVRDALARLDVALSTRASESTLAALNAKFPSAVALADNLPNPSTTIVGSALLGFDGTYWRRVAVDAASRLRVVAEVVANPPNLDVALSTRASESTLAALNAKFPSATALSDTLSNPSTTIVGAASLGWDGANWRRLAADATGRLKVAAEVVANPPNLDVALSTRASEATLSALNAKFPGAAALGDSLANPSTTIVGAAALLWTGSAWARAIGQSLDVAGVSGYALGVVPAHLPARAPYTIDNISVTTTEGSTAIGAPGAKIVAIRNRGPSDVLIGINGAVPTTNPLVVRANTVRVIVHKGITQVNYKVAAGSATIEITYIN